MVAVCDTTHTVGTAACREQEMLATFAEFALKSENIDLIMREACRCVCEAVKADMVLMYRLGNQARTVQLRAGVGIDELHVGGTVARRDEGSLESALLDSGEPVIVPNVEIETGLETKNLLQRFGQRGLALLPLLDGPGAPVLGHLHISTREPRDFSSDLPFLRIYAGLVATGIMRVESNEARQRETKAHQAVERNLELIVENIPQFIWCADANARWRWTSPQWQLITGQRKRSSLGLGWRTKVHPEDLPAVDKAWSAAAIERLFEVHCRIWHDNESGYRWYYGRALPYWENETTFRWMGTFTDIHEQRRLEVSQQLLVAELQHRTRNLLTIVEGIALQTAATARQWSEFAPAFHGRLQAIARVQTLLTDADTKPVTMNDLVSMEIDSIGDAVSTVGLSVGGPDVNLSRTIVQMLALLLHELLTNSLKYGVLRAGTGSIAISWDIDDPLSRFTLKWHEAGFSSIQSTPASRKGFGRELIERALPRQLGGSSTYELRESDLACCIVVPLRANGVAA